MTTPAIKGVASTNAGDEDARARRPTTTSSAISRMAGHCPDGSRQRRTASVVTAATQSAACRGVGFRSGQDPASQPASDREGNHDQEVNQEGQFQTGPMSADQ